MNMEDSTECEDEKREIVGSAALANAIGEKSAVDNSLPASDSPKNADCIQKHDAAKDNLAEENVSKGMIDTEKGKNEQKSDVCSTGENIPVPQSSDTAIVEKTEKMTIETSTAVNEETHSGDKVDTADSKDESNDSGKSEDKSPSPKRPKRSSDDKYPRYDAKNFEYDPNGLKMSVDTLSDYLVLSAFRKEGCLDSLENSPANSDSHSSHTNGGIPKDEVAAERNSNTGECNEQESAPCSSEMSTIDKVIDENNRRDLRVERRAGRAQQIPENPEGGGSAGGDLGRGRGGGRGAGAGAAGAGRGRGFVVNDEGADANNTHQGAGAGANNQGGNNGGDDEDEGEFEDDGEEPSSTEEEEEEPPDDDDDDDDEEDGEEEEVVEEEETSDDDNNSDDSDVPPLILAQFVVGEGGDGSASPTPPGPANQPPAPGAKEEAASDAGPSKPNEANSSAGGSGSSSNAGNTGERSAGSSETPSSDNVESGSEAAGASCSREVPAGDNGLGVEDAVEPEQQQANLAVDGPGEDDENEEEEEDEDDESLSDEEEEENGDDDDINDEGGDGGEGGVHGPPFVDMGGGGDDGRQPRRDIRGGGEGPANRGGAGDGPPIIGEAGGGNQQAADHILKEAPLETDEIEDNIHHLNKVAAEEGEKNVSVMDKPIEELKCESKAQQSGPMEVDEEEQPAKDKKSDGVGDIPLPDSEISPLTSEIPSSNFVEDSKEDPNCDGKLLQDSRKEVNDASEHPDKESTQSNVSISNSETDRKEETPVAVIQSETIKTDKVIANCNVDYQSPKPQDKNQMDEAQHESGQDVGRVNDQDSSPDDERDIPQNENITPIVSKDNEDSIDDVLCTDKVIEPSSILLHDSCEISGTCSSSSKNDKDSKTLVVTHEINTTTSFSHLDHVNNGTIVRCINHELGSELNGCSSTKDSNADGTNCVTEAQSTENVSLLDSKIDNTKSKIDNYEESANSSLDTEVTKLEPTLIEESSQHNPSEECVPITNIDSPSDVDKCCDNKDDAENEVSKPSAVGDTDIEENKSPSSDDVTEDININVNHPEMENQVHPIERSKISSETVSDVKSEVEDVNIDSELKIIHDSGPDSPELIKRIPDDISEDSGCSGKLSDEVSVKKLNCDAAILPCNITIDSNDVKPDYNVELPDPNASSQLGNESDCEILPSDVKPKLETPLVENREDDEQKYIKDENQSFVAGKSSVVEFVENSVLDGKITHSVEKLIKDKPQTVENPAIDSKISVSDESAEVEGDNISSTVESIKTETQCAEKSELDDKISYSDKKNMKVEKASIKCETQTVDNLSVNDKDTSISFRVEPQSLKDLEVDNKLPSNQEPMNSESQIFGNPTTDEKPSIPDVESKDEFQSVVTPVVDEKIPSNDEPMNCDNPAEDEKPSISSVESKDESNSVQICSVNDDITVKSEDQSIPTVMIEQDTTDNKSSGNELSTDENKSISEAPLQKIEVDKTSVSIVQDLTDNKNSAGYSSVDENKSKIDSESQNLERNATFEKPELDTTDSTSVIEESFSSDSKISAEDLLIDNSNQSINISNPSVEPSNPSVDTVEPSENNLQSSCTHVTGPNTQSICEQMLQSVEGDEVEKKETDPEKSSSTEKTDDKAEKKNEETVEASIDTTSSSAQEGDENTALKPEENEEDLRQPIVNLEKLQSPLVERTSVSLATCELCGGACPTQQCLRLRRNSVSGRVTRRGRGRPRSNENSTDGANTTENTTYTCLLCRKVMPDRESSRKHVQTSHDIICSTCGGVFHDCNALKEHRTQDKCGNADEIEECDPDDSSKDADAVSSGWKLPKRASKSFDFLGTLFASDNDDDSPTDDEDSDFTCDDHEIEEAEKEEDLDVKKSESRRKSLRNFRARQGKQDDTLVVGKRSFRLSKNSTIHKPVAGSKGFAQRNKCIGNLESTVALTKRGAPIPLRVLRKSLLENNGNLSAFGRGRNAASIGSSVLVTCSSSKEDDNDSQSKDPSFDDDTISLRSGNSISRGENSISLRSSMRISSKSNDDDIDDDEDDEDDDSGLCDNVSQLGSNSELNQSQQAGRVKCDHCGSTYSTKSNLQRHIANHCRALNGVDKDSRRKKADDLKRKKLRKYYNTGSCAKRRRRSFGGAGSSSLEEESESSDNEYSDGANSSKTQRDKGTSTTGLVYSPRLILHRIDNGKIDSITADGKSESEEIVNISETDKSIQVGQGECNIRSAKNFRCTDCRRSFYTQDDLSLHGMIHANRTDFPCPRCNKVFPTFPNLRVHMRTHATGPPCLCDVCGKAFNTPSSLKVHMKTHDDDEKFNCSYCNRTFNFVGNLKVHERLHTGEKPYKCSLCERCFTQSTSLKLHVQSLHMQQRIPLPCDKCCRKFRSKETLERHKLCHVDYRRFKCDICDSVSFNNRAGLKHHMETKHLCSDGGVVDLIGNKSPIDPMNQQSATVQDHNLTGNQNCVAKLPSISVLGVKSSINSVEDSGQMMGLSPLQNLVQSARFNPQGGGLINEQSTTNLPSAASKSTSAPQNHQFCMNGHNLSITPRECNDYCKVPVLNQGGFNMDANRGSNVSATSDACDFNNSTPLKERLDTTLSDLSSGTVGDNRNHLTVNNTGFGDLSPINSSISGIKNNICPPQYNVAMSSRGGMGRGGRGSRGGRGRGGSFNFQNFPPHKCGACAARFDKKVSLRRHIKETHSGPFGDVNETLMQLQNDLEDLQRIYGNKKVENNRRGAGRRRSVEGRKQSTDLESSFDESGVTEAPQPGTFNDSNKPETTFTSSFNVESLLSKSPGDGDARTATGTGGESSVESGEGAFPQANQTHLSSKSADLDSSSNTDNFNELEGGKLDDESGKSGKSRTKYEFGCHLCDKSFPTTMGLVRHKNFVHKVPSERCRLPMRDKPFECEYCTKRFTFETGAQKHIQRHIEKGHSKRVKKEKVIRKPSANQLNYPSTSSVNSSSSYSAPPSVDSTYASTSGQHVVSATSTLRPDSRADMSDLNRPTSLPSFKWNDYRIGPDVARSPLVNPNDTSGLTINQNHVYDPYHNNPNSWAAMNQKPNFYKNHTYDKTIYPISTSSTSHNEFGYDTFSKPLSVTPSLFSHNNTNLYPGATSYSEGAASKSSSSFSLPASYNDATSSTYAQSAQPAQSTSTYVTQEFMPKTSTENDYTYSSTPFVGSSHQTTYSGVKSEPSAAFNDNQAGNYFKSDSDYSNAPLASYEAKSAPTFEPKIPQNVGSDQFMFNNATDDSSYMKNAFHAAHLLDASNYEKTYYNLDSNKFKSDSAYNQSTAPESSYSLTRLDGYATSPTPSVSKPTSPYYDTQLKPQLIPPTGTKEENFVNYYKSYQYTEMPPAAGQTYEKMDRTDANNDRNYGANEWGGMMYNNL